MKTLTIKTSAMRSGYQATLADDPGTKATSAAGPYFAAYSLAVRLFLGHSKLAQHKREDLDRVRVRPIGHGSYRATYNY
jgi:hypothetical protein